MRITHFPLCRQVWIFGDAWCSTWLAVDVWMCTASILNLCAISLDRYLAVTRPVTYPSLMCHRRARWLVCFVWVLSFVICFPPLVGWKDHVQANDDQLLGELAALTAKNRTEPTTGAVERGSPTL